MNLARWAGAIVLFLLVGACGYYVTAIVAGVLLGMRIASGDMSFADISDPVTQRLVEAVAATGGAVLAWFIVGRRYWRRWRQRPSLPKQ